MCAEIQDTAEWDAMLPLAVFQYNSRRHSALGFSPYEATFVVRPRLPLQWNLLTEQEQRQWQIPTLTNEQRNSQMRIRAMERDRTMAILRERADALQGRTLSSSHPYKVGDVVMKKLHSRTKMQTRTIYRTICGHQVVPRRSGDRDSRWRSDACER